MESFGAHLKAQREKKGIRLEEIASITKIHLHALEMLESDKWEQLPPEPFIRGFIVAYAKYVGLNTSEVLDRFREATGTTPVVDPDGLATSAPPMGMGLSTPHLNSKTPIPAGATPDLVSQVRLPSGAKIVTAISLIAVVGLAALLISIGRDSNPPVASSPSVSEPSATPVAISPVEPVVANQERKPAAATQEPAVKLAEPIVAPAVPTPAPSASVAGPALANPVTPAEQAPAHEIIVEGKARTWLKVVIDDNPPTEYFLAEGKSATYKAAKKVKVVLGNSTGSRVTHNGQVVEGKQFLGTIRSYIFPENARFPQDSPSKRTPTATETPSE